MSALAPYAKGFLDELQKLAEEERPKPKKVQTIPWNTGAYLKHLGIGAAIGGGLGVAGGLALKDPQLAGVGGLIGASAGVLGGHAYSPHGDVNIYDNGHIEAVPSLITRLLHGRTKEAAKPTKETRKGWLASKTRRGSPPMRVSTMLKKEKDGTLGGYKLAHVLSSFAKLGEAIVPVLGKDDPGAAGRVKRPGDMPSRDDVGGTIAKREDGRGNAATLNGPQTVFEISSQPGERSE